MENLILLILVMVLALQIRNTIINHMRYKKAAERRTEDNKKYAEWEKGYKEWLKM